MHPTPPTRRSPRPSGSEVSKADVTNPRLADLATLADLQAWLDRRYLIRADILERDYGRYRPGQTLVDVLNGLGVRPRRRSEPKADRASPGSTAPARSKAGSPKTGARRG